MSEPYQIFVLMPSGLPAEQVVFGTHRALEQVGGSLDEDSTLMLNDTPTEEPEPEQIYDTRNALLKLARWPTLGSVVYAMPEGMTTVSYKGPESSGIVQSIKISVLMRAFEKGGDESRNRYTSLAELLHNEFNARRTIMDWGLEYRGFNWSDEIERLRQGTFDETYEIVDLRHS